MSRRVLPLALLATVIAATVTACGSQPVRGASRGRMSVVASFYPLQWMAQQVGGDRVVVTSLTKPGAEPHDLELVPREVAEVVSANVVVYLSGFQPSVDAATREAAGSLVFDARGPADLDLVSKPAEERGEGPPTTGSTDPHFWLDPIRLAAVAEALATRLGRVDPVHADEYLVNAARLKRRLDDLDRQYRAGLRSCASRDLVTSHSAFVYLARRYNLHPRAVTGLAAEGEPSPNRLADVAGFATKHDVRTIYVETLVSPATARAVARETGASTVVLDPIEGLNDTSDGGDYVAIMRSNLVQLRQGQRCR